jgi:hypothetical protein
MLGQYSVPFSLAVAAWRDPEDPAAFAADCVHDSAVLDLAARIELETGDAPGWGAHLSVALRDGRKLTGRLRAQMYEFRARHLTGRPGMTQQNQS